MFCVCFKHRDADLINLCKTDTQLKILINNWQLFFFLQLLVKQVFLLKRRLPRLFLPKSDFTPQVNHDWRCAGGAECLQKIQTAIDQQSRITQIEPSIDLTNVTCPTGPFLDTVCSMYLYLLVFYRFQQFKMERGTVFYYFRVQFEKMRCFYKPLRVCKIYNRAVEQ